MQVGNAGLEDDVTELRLPDQSMIECPTRLSQSVDIIIGQPDMRRGVRLTVRVNNEDAGAGASEDIRKSNARRRLECAAFLKGDGNTLALAVRRV